MDNVQELTFESESLQLFAPMLVAAIEATGARHLYQAPGGGEGEPEAQYPSHAAAYMMSFLGHEPHSFKYAPPNRPANASHYRLICRLDRADHPRPFEQAVPVADAADAAAKVVALLRRADGRRFLEQTGEGPFDGCDGSVGFGYRMHFGPLSGGLVIALCHIYHSK